MQKYIVTLVSSATLFPKLIVKVIYRKKDISHSKVNFQIQNKCSFFKLSLNAYIK